MCDCWPNDLHFVPLSPSVEKRVLDSQDFARASFWNDFRPDSVGSEHKSSNRSSAFPFTVILGEEKHEVALEAKPGGPQEFKHVDINHFRHVHCSHHFCTSYDLNNLGFIKRQAETKWCRYRSSCLIEWGKCG